VAASRAALERAFELARGLGEAEWMAQAALDLGSSSSWGLWEDLWLPDETAVSLLEGALAALPEVDSVSRARVLGQLAVQFRTEDELHTRSEQALQMARRLHDPLALTDALGARLVAWPVTGADERLTYADELVVMADAAGLREPAVLGRQFRVILLLQRGDVLEAEAELARFEYAARELRQPILLVHLQWLHSMWAMLGGRLEDAERLAAEALPATAAPIRSGPARPTPGSSRSSGASRAASPRWSRRWASAWTSSPVPTSGGRRCCCCWPRRAGTTRPARCSTPWWPTASWTSATTTRIRSRPTRRRHRP